MDPFAKPAVEERPKFFQSASGELVEVTDDLIEACYTVKCLIAGRGRMAFRNSLGGVFVYEKGRVIHQKEQKIMASLLQNDAERLVVLVHDVRTPVLRRLLDFISFHLTDASEREKKQFNQTYIEQSSQLLCELASAAYYLDHKPLVNITSKAIAGQISGKTTEELREVLGTQNEPPMPASMTKDLPARFRLQAKVDSKKQREKLAAMALAQEGAKAIEGPPAPLPDAKPPPAEKFPENASVDDILAMLGEDSSKSAKKSGTKGKKTKHEKKSSTKPLDESKETVALKETATRRETVTNKEVASHSKEISKETSSTHVPSIVTKVDSPNKSHDRHVMDEAQEGVWETTEKKKRRLSPVVQSSSKLVKSSPSNQLSKSPSASSLAAQATNISSSTSHLPHPSYLAATKASPMSAAASNATGAADSSTATRQKRPLNLSGSSATSAVSATSAASVTSNTSAYSFHSSGTVSSRGVGGNEGESSETLPLTSQPSRLSQPTPTTITPATSIQATQYTVSQDEMTVSTSLPSQSSFITPNCHDCYHPLPSCVCEDSGEGSSAWKCQEELRRTSELVLPIKAPLPSTTSPSLYYGPSTTAHLTEEPQRVVGYQGRRDANMSTSHVLSAPMVDYLTFASPFAVHNQDAMYAAARGYAVPVSGQTALSSVQASSATGSAPLNASKSTMPSMSPYENDDAPPGILTGSTHLASASRVSSSSGAPTNNAVMDFPPGLVGPGQAVANGPNATMNPFTSSAYGPSTLQPASSLPPNHLYRHQTLLGQGSAPGSRSQPVTFGSLAQEMTQSRTQHGFRTPQEGSQPLSARSSTSLLLSDPDSAFSIETSSFNFQFPPITSSSSSAQFYWGAEEEEEGIDMVHPVREEMDKGRTPMGLNSDPMVGLNSDRMMGLNSDRMMGLNSDRVSPTGRTSPSLLSSANHHGSESATRGILPSLGQSPPSTNASTMMDSSMMAPSHSSSMMASSHSSSSPMTSHVNVAPSPRSPAPPSSHSIFPSSFTSFEADMLDYRMMGIEDQGNSRGFSTTLPFSSSGLPPSFDQLSFMNAPFDRHHLMHDASPALT